MTVGGKTPTSPMYAGRSSYDELGLTHINPGSAVTGTYLESGCVITVLNH